MQLPSYYSPPPIKQTLPVSATPLSPPLAGSSCLQQPSQPTVLSAPIDTGPFGLGSPEKAVAKFPGRDKKSLTNLSVELARSVVFGEEVMSTSSVSGRNDTNQLDPEKVLYMKNIVRTRVATRMNDLEFELVWQKCMENVSKKCQKLRQDKKNRKYM